MPSRTCKCNTLQRENSRSPCKRSVPVSDMIHKDCAAKLGLSSPYLTEDARVKHEERKKKDAERMKRKYHDNEKYRELKIKSAKTRYAEKRASDSGNRNQGGDAHGFMEFQASEFAATSSGMPTGNPAMDSGSMVIQRDFLPNTLPQGGHAHAATQSQRHRLHRQASTRQHGRRFTHPLPAESAGNAAFRDGHYPSHRGMAYISQPHPQHPFAGGWQSHDSLFHAAGAHSTLDFLRGTADVGVTPISSAAAFGPGGPTIPGVYKVEADGSMQLLSEQNFPDKPPHAGPSLVNGGMPAQKDDMSQFHRHLFQHMGLGPRTQPYVLGIGSETADLSSRPPAEISFSSDESMLDDRQAHPPVGADGQKSLRKRKEMPGAHHHYLMSEGTVPPKKESVALSTVSSARGVAGGMEDTYGIGEVEPVLGYGIPSQLSDTADAVSSSAFSWP
eukprot:m.439729 g.439729  ORF g.439729 m.439729 type:complete len:445 (-) comp21457_c0_seq1:525-1859(-)